MDNDNGPHIRVLDELALDSRSSPARWNVSNPITAFGSVFEPNNATFGASAVTSWRVFNEDNESLKMHCFSHITHILNLQDIRTCCQ